MNFNEQVQKKHGISASTFLVPATNHPFLVTPLFIKKIKGQKSGFNIANPRPTIKRSLAPHSICEELERLNLPANKDIIGRMERAPIELETFHHIYNRGTDKRVVFNDREDHNRFVLYLNILNDKEIISPADNMALAEGQNEVILSSERLINLIAFCLMPNHFHLLLHERTTGGISKFMQRLSTAYTMYFNEKNERSGALFQGRFKNKFIDSETYLLKIIDYIHLNPKKLTGSLDGHEWSSYHHYCGKNKFSYMLQPEALDGFTKIPTGDEYREWIDSQKDFDEISHLLIDGKNQK